MKINISTILSEEFRNQFIVKEGAINGIPCILVIGKPDTKWTKENIIFRSSVWDMGGNLISASFKKFGYLNEIPDAFESPKNLDRTNINFKIDGSTYICDLIADELSVRTRGTFSYETLENATDFALMIKKYPQIEQFLRLKPYYTLIFEIVAQSNRIIIDYGKDTEIYLIGCIDKDGYQLLHQYTLDQIADAWKFKRPERIQSNSLDELIKNIAASTGIEGACLYANNDQDIFKIKSDFWLKLNALKNDLSYFDRIKDLYFSTNCNSIQDLKDYIVKNFDYECMVFCSDNLNKLEELLIKTEKKYSEILAFINENKLKEIPRKEAAQTILSKDREFACFYFGILDNQDFKKLEKRMLDKINENYLR